MNRSLILFTALSSIAFRPYKVEKIETTPRVAELVTAERFPGADSVVVEEYAEVRLFDLKQPEAGFLWTEGARIKVLSPAGRAMARVGVGGSREVELLSVGGRTFSSPAAVRELTGKAVAFFGDAEPLSPMYSDRVSGFYDVPGAELGDMIEYRVQYHRKGAQALSAWKFNRTEAPVIESRISLVLPEGWKVDHVLMVDGAAKTITPDKKSEEGQVRWTFLQKDMKAIELERLGPAEIDLGHVLFLSVSPPEKKEKPSWEDVAAHYRKFVDELPPIPAGALAGAGAPERTPRAIFEWVRDHVRYVAIHEGLGGLKPHAPGQVLVQRWGDCKDMATLLVSLYRQAGIEAYQVLVASTGRGRVKSPLPRIGAFDHVIVAIAKQGGGYDYVDPTAKPLVFGELSTQIQGQMGLVIKPNGSEPIELPWTEGRRWALTWTIDQDGLQALLEMDGEGASRWRGWSKRSAKAQKRAVRNLLAESGAATVLTASIAESGNNVRVGATYRPKRLMIDSPEGKFVVLGKLFSSAGEYRVAKDRKSPVELGPPGEIVERVIFKKSRGETVVRAPRPISWKSTSLSFELTVRDDAEAITIERRFAFKTPRMPPDKFADLAKLAELIHQSAVEALLVRGPAPLTMNEVVR